MNGRIVTTSGAMRAWWSVLMVVVVAVVIMLAGFVYTSHVQRQSEERYIEYTRHAQQQSDARWYPLLIIADRPRPTPPQTPDEAEARRRLHQLRLDLGCGGP